jgi:hypothetical protein
MPCGNGFHNSRRLQEFLLPHSFFIHLSIAFYEIALNRSVVFPKQIITGYAFPYQIIEHVYTPFPIAPVLAEYPDSRMRHLIL